MMVFKALLAISAMCILRPQHEVETVAWRDHLKLTWHDFKGRPNASVSAAAVTASGITFGFSIKETKTRVVGFDTAVFAHFYTQRSWYIKAQVDARILAHEQLHFDITELYARKFRKRIDELNISNDIKSQLQSLHETINAELAATQKRYDAETDNSLNVVAQNRWATYINKELHKLDTYKSKD